MLLVTQGRTLTPGACQLSVQERERHTDRDRQRQRQGQRERERERERDLKDMKNMYLNIYRENAM